MTRLASRSMLLLAPCLMLGCATVPDASAPAATTMAIGTVQGQGAQSPLPGQAVTIEGVVVARVGAADAVEGWFVQDAGDGDEATSDAVFVSAADSGVALQVGDRVRVRGVVAEQAQGRGTRTSIEQARIDPRGRGTVTPAKVAKTPADWEQLEGMAVQFDAPLWLADSAEMDKRGRVLASIDGRLWQPGERAAPGSEQARAVATDNARRQLWLETGKGDAAAAWPVGLDRARSGSRLDDVAGVLDQAGAGYRLRLTATPTLQASARPQPPQVPGNLRVAALNLENLFNGDGHGGGFPTPRGARTPAELAAQLAKHVATIDGLDADVVALMELENDGYGTDSSLAALVAALNANGGDWHAVDAGKGPGDNAIRVGLIYRGDRVRTQGKPATLEQGPFGPHSRVPMAQAFVPLRAGRVAGPAFVVVANHFKSKGCSGAENGDRDQGDGAACWNATRTESAHLLDAWLRTDPTGHGERTLIVGDLNAYAGEEPLRTLAASGWRDAFAVAGIESPYSYVYDGQLGRLDHALLSPALAKHLRGAAEWHSNADEAENAGYRAGGSGPWRSSDHDPLLLGFDLR